jgi:hypothetical protein
MNKSESIKELATALSKAQGEMPAVKFDSQNPFLKSKYATLGAVIETSRPILAKHGLSMAQFPTSEGERIGITTILSHSSGEWMNDTVYIPITDSKGLSIAQSSGVVFSYLRRYSWASVLGLYADEDTDGGHPAKQERPEAAPETPKRIWTIQQKQAILDAGHAENVFEAQAMLELSALKENSGTAVIASWAKYYRDARNAGSETVSAAQVANEAYLKAKKAAK